MKPAKILIIEDSSTISGMLMKVLQKAGYSVTRTPNGRFGLEMAIKEKPELILLDISIPGLNGIEVCKAIRKNPETNRTKIIIVSALAEDKDMDDARAAGAELYITKPFLMEEVLNSIKSVLGEN